VARHPYECSDWDQIEKSPRSCSTPATLARGARRAAATSGGLRAKLKSATEKLTARERMALRAMAMTD